MSGKPSHLFKKVKCSSSKTTYKSKRTTSGLSKDTWYSNWITQKESDQTPLCCSVRSLPLQSASGNCLQNLGFIFVSERSQERHSLTWERAFGWDHCNLKSICWHPKRWWVISEGHKNSTCLFSQTFSYRHCIPLELRRLRSCVRLLSIMMTDRCHITVDTVDI